MLAVISSLCLLAAPALAQPETSAIPEAVTQYAAELKKWRATKKASPLEPVFTLGMEALSGGLAETLQSASSEVRQNIEKAMEGFEFSSHKKTGTLTIRPRYSFFANQADWHGVLADKEFFAIARRTVNADGSFAFSKPVSEGNRCTTLAGGKIEKIVTATNVYDLKYPAHYAELREEWLTALWAAVLENDCICESQEKAVEALTSLHKAVRGRAREGDVSALLAQAKDKDTKLRFNCVK